MNRRQFLGSTLGWLAGLLSGSATSERKPISEFTLRYRSEDFVVPEGVIWKLTWRSPYAPGEVTPGYDVRIISGEARMGEHGELLVRAYDSRPGQNGLLDLKAADGKDAVIWLESGMRFSLANNLIEARVADYRKIQG